MEQNYRISVKIGDTSFEIESSDAKWIENKEKKYLEKLFGRIPKTKAKLTVERKIPVAEVPPKMTLDEFYRMYVKKIKSRATTVVYFVYYLQKIRKKDKIKTADVTTCFREIGYPNWNRINMTDTLASAKRRALINYVNKLWSLTTTGEDYVFNAITGKGK